MKPLPESFVERIKNQYPNDHSVFLESFDRPVVHSVHRHPRKGNSLFEDLEAVQWWDHGFYLKERPIFTLDPLFHAGAYYSQESSSMFVGQLAAEIAQGREGLRVLDLCAAPGGKSILLSEVIGSTGLLVSNEISNSRNMILRENLTKWGAENVVVTCNDPKAFEALEGFFDIVLVDAPCSGEGMFRKDETAREEWSPANVLMCAERQEGIMKYAMMAVKPGGHLIYSTCTFSQEENDQQCEGIAQSAGWSGVFLKKNFDTVVRDEFADYECYRFLPHRVRGEGFFASVFTKSEGHEFRLPKRVQQDWYRALTAAEKCALSKMANGETVINKRNEVFDIPGGFDLLSYLVQNFIVTKAGVGLGELIRNELIPAHDVAMTLRQLDYPRIEVDQDLALNYLRREEIKIESPTQGWAILTHRGVNLGWVKTLKNRVNNYYPKEWKIRMA